MVCPQFGIRQIGAAGSAFERAVPERLFADPTKPLDDPSQPQGISAVKAMAIAAANGQRIYTLNAQNQAYHPGIVAGLNTDLDTKAEITNALNAGMEVTVHQAEINAHGWTGMGYIILDPETGAGAYKISGGANGGLVVLAVFGMVMLFLSLLPAVLLGSLAVLIAWLLPIIVSASLYVYAMYQITKDWSFSDWKGFLEFFKPALFVVSTVRIILMAAELVSRSVMSIIAYLLFNLSSDSRGEP